MGAHDNIFNLAKMRLACSITTERLNYKVSSFPSGERHGVHPNYSKSPKIDEEHLSVTKITNHHNNIIKSSVTM